MITQYNDNAKKQQKQIVQNLLKQLDALDIEFLTSVEPMDIYYTDEEEKDCADYRHCEKVQEIVRSLRQLKFLRKSERLLPFTHNQ